MSAIEIKDAVVRLGGRPVLRGITFEVPVGSAVALLGANGSGKSTAVRALVGLVPLESGTIQVLGKPSDKLDRRLLGYVPQRTTAASGVPSTVGEVVAAGLLATSGWRGMVRHRPAGHAQIAEALEAVGLGHRVEDCVAHLSGGQQQRVLIARALVGRPKLLVMDEPTTGVDLASQQSLAEVLSRFTAAGGSVLLVAHELGPLAPVVDRAVVLRGGRVIHDGAVPAPFGHHADPDHEHVHPHDDAFTSERGLLT